MMVDLCLGLYFIINNYHVNFDYIFPFVGVFFALSIAIGMCLTCSECCSRVPEEERQSGCDVMVKKPCCSLYIILYQLREQSSTTDVEPVEFSNQITANQIANTVTPGEITPVVQLGQNLLAPK